MKMQRPDVHKLPEIETASSSRTFSQAEEIYEQEQKIQNRKEPHEKPIYLLADREQAS